MLDETRFTKKQLKKHGHRRCKTCTIKKQIADADAE
jgi:hypothetical protein